MVQLLVHDAKYGIFSGIFKGKSLKREVRNPKNEGKIPLLRRPDQIARMPYSCNICKNCLLGICIGTGSKTSKHLQLNKKYIRRNRNRTKSYYITVGHAEELQPDD